MKCSNCSDKALYEYRLTQAVSQFYCGSHLPRFLEPRRKAGALTITQHHEDTVKEALALLSPPVVNTEVTEELPEPVIEEAPKPVRKRKPKNADNS